MNNLDRRDFLKHTLALVAAQALAGCTAATVSRKAARKAWKLGMQGAKTMDCTLSQEIAIMSQLGYDCLELRDWKLRAFLKERSLDDLRTMFAKANLQPLNISAIELNSLGPGTNRDRRREDHEWYFRMAHEIGCQFVEFVHFAPLAGDVNTKEIKQRAVDDFKYMSDLAGEYQVTALYEFLGAYNLPIHNIDDTMEVLDLANRQNLGWIFDFYQFYVTDGSIEALARSNVDNLHVVHICDAKDLPYEKLAVPHSERLLPGDGVCETDKILRTLYRIGYRGPFVLELYNNEFMDIPPEDFARLGKGKIINVLDKYFGPAA